MNPGINRRSTIPTRCASATILSFSGPSPTITSLTLSPAAAHARTSLGRFLTARNPATVPTTTSPTRRVKPGNAPRWGFFSKRFTSMPLGMWWIFCSGCFQTSLAIRASCSDGTTSAIASPSANLRNQFRFQLSFFCSSSLKPSSWWISGGRPSILENSVRAITPSIEPQL